jgi:uncharacterized cupin superfamily protein
MSHTIKNLNDVHDVAEDHGLGEHGEARFAMGDLEARQTGLSHQRLRPGKRQAFGHRHDEAEEIYLVLSGGGRVGRPRRGEAQAAQRGSSALC